MAIDAIALRLIEDAQDKQDAVGQRMTAYLEGASELGLGESAEWRIQTIEWE